MLGAIDLELPSGMSSPGRAQLTGNGRFDEKIPIKGLKDKLKRAAINDYDDVFLSPNQIAADREPRMNRGSLACSPVLV